MTGLGREGCDRIMLAIYVHMVGLRRLAAPRSRNCTESSRTGRSFYLDGNLIREIQSRLSRTVWGEVGPKLCSALMSTWSFGDT